MMTEPNLSTTQKAQAVNFDSNQYGTFAEIGAGQEVARWFFRVGGAAGTIAKSMSAYDMAVSDAIYGKSRRYVSQERLHHMLEHEYGLLHERLAVERGDEARFFVFADTVAARSYSRQQDGLGWMGIRFQGAPGQEPNDIILHVRLLDEDNLKQQEAAGIIGVNLVHAAMHYTTDPHRILGSLLDNLEPWRAEIGMVRFTGPDYAGVDNRLMALELVKRGLAKATLFNVGGEVVHPSEVLYGKPIIVERGSFRPVTHTTLHMLQSSKAQFVQEPSVQGENMTVLFEMTLHNLTDGDGINEQDFLERVDILGAVGEDLAENYHIMVSNFAEYYRLAAYLLRYSKEPIGVAMGVPTLKELFEEKYYEELEGGILESFGRMFKNDLRLYVYPSLAEGGQVLNARNLQVASHLQSLYEYLLSNGFIRRIEDFREDYLPILSRDALKKIRSGDPQWEQSVPESVAQLIRERGLLGYQSAADPATT
ncbi:MAG: TonB-dependent receptor [Limisphaerales bacterium]